jgi:hypothetical protein
MKVLQWRKAEIDTQLHRALLVSRQQHESEEVHVTVTRSQELEARVKWMHDVIQDELEKPLELSKFEAEELAADEERFARACATQVRAQRQLVRRVQELVQRRGHTSSGLHAGSSAVDPGSEPGAEVQVPQGTSRSAFEVGPGRPGSAHGSAHDSAHGSTHGSARGSAPSSAHGSARDSAREAGGGSAGGSDGDGPQSSRREADGEDGKADHGDHHDGHGDGGDGSGGGSGGDSDGGGESGDRGAAASARPSGSAGAGPGAGAGAGSGSRPSAHRPSDPSATSSHRPTTAPDPLSRLAALERQIIEAARRGRPRAGRVASLRARRSHSPVAIKL